MDIKTTDDFIGVIEDHPDGDVFLTLGYADGSWTRFPHDAFRSWTGKDASDGPFRFEIGRGSIVGAGSELRLGDPKQSLTIGNWTAIGQRVRFVLGGVHRTNTAAIVDFGHYGLRSPWPTLKRYEMRIGHDVWVGDEAFFLPGCDIATGCVIGARSVVPMAMDTEPYGVYVGSPARLVKFRFAESVREALLELAWWELPLGWVRENNDLFMSDLVEDEARALETVAELAELKAAWLAAHPPLLPFDDAGDPGTVAPQ